MKSFEEVGSAELELVEGGGLLVPVIVIGGLAIAGAFAYGYYQGSKDCPFTPKS